MKTRKAKAGAREPMARLRNRLLALSPEEQDALRAALTPPKRAGTHPRTGNQASTRMIAFKVTPEEEAILKEAAKDWPRQVSGYVRDHLPCFRAVKK